MSLTSGDMMPRNHLELTQGKAGPRKSGTGVRQSALGRKVTGAHEDLREIAYETFGAASPL